MDKGHTPKKVSIRKGSVSQGLCRLCGGLNNTRHLSNVISGSGKQKNLAKKVSESCGIFIDEADSLPKTLCRKCLTFVESVCEFKQRCQRTQESLGQQVYAKRCPEKSPCLTEAPTKRQVITEDNQPETEKKSTGTVKKRLFLCTEQVKILPKETNQPASDDELLKSTSIHREDIMNTFQVEKMTAALNTKSVFAVIEGIMKYCPAIVEAMKEVFINDIKRSCQKLCVRSNGSILYASQNSYDVLEHFSFSSLWVEIEANIPFLIDVMNAISGVEKVRSKKDLQSKYGFLYSVLMNIRWHELSLVQRINTLCLIEGGCTKQVHNKVF